MRAKPPSKKVRKSMNVYNKDMWDKSGWASRKYHATKKGVMIESR